MQELNSSINSDKSSPQAIEASTTLLPESTCQAIAAENPTAETVEDAAPLAVSLSPRPIQQEASTIPDSIDRELAVPQPKRRKKQFQSSEARVSVQDHQSPPPSPLPRPSFDEPQPAVNAPIVEAIVAQAANSPSPHNAISTRPEALFTEADTHAPHDTLVAAVEARATIEVLKVTAAAPAPGSKVRLHCRSLI